jgi:hypothetical protein
MESPGSTLTSAAFTWCTVLAIIFGVIGWVQIWHIMLQIHKAARVGDMVRGDCKFSYMEYESPLRYVRALVNDRNYLPRLRDALNMLGRGTFFLCLSIILGPALATLNCGRKGKVVGECADQKEGARPKMTRVGAVLLLVVLFYAGGMVGKGEAAPSVLGANIDDGSAYKKVIGIQTTIFVSLLFIYVYPKYYAHVEFFDRDNTFIADRLWLLALFLLQIILMFGTHMYFKLDAFLKAYRSQVEKTHYAMVELTHVNTANDKRGKAFKALLLKNMLRLPELIKIRPDDAPSLADAVDALNKQEIPYYIFHEEGAELALFAENVLKVQDMSWIKANKETSEKERIRANMTEKAYQEIVKNPNFSEKKTEWVKLDAIRDHMKELRDQNEEFSKAVGGLTAMVTVGSCVAIAIPTYILYKSLAPAIFGL